MDTVVKNTTVNAPLDETLWLEADWHKVTRNVRRIQNRIVIATQAKDWRSVRNLQGLLTRSLSAKLLAVKRVVANSGNRTSGIDGKTWRSYSEKSKAVFALGSKGYKAKPLKRVYIPKSNGKRRPLGIPTVHDRAMQALYKLALEPVTETQADKHSYGFRPERSTADAIGQCFNLLAKGKGVEWVLEADIEGCFDNIHHQWLLNNTPLNKKILKQWLKAGFVEKGSLHPTVAGTPQGGIISPVLMNLTLDSLEKRLALCFGAPKTPRGSQNKVYLVRYADDFIITGQNPALLEKEVKPLVIEFLKERGLALSSKKTHITSIHKGFDFLGQTVRKFRGKKLFIQPSKKNQRLFREKVSQLIKSLRGAPQEKVINALNPQISGWGNYHQHVVSKKVFSDLDDWLWKALWKWSYQRHSNKTKTWVAKKYYHSIGLRNWEFGCKTPFQDKIKIKPLKRLAAIPIRRHVKIKGDANPYDPQWELYFEQRHDAQMKKASKGRVLSLYRNQRGKCSSCNRNVTQSTGWNVHHKVEKSKGGSDLLSNLVLLHPECHKQLHSRLKARLPVSGSLSHA